MKYMLLIYSNPTSWEALTEQERVALADEHDVLTRELVDSGEWLDGAPLADPLTTRTVRVRNGVPVTTDGPFVETKEHLAGYDLVDCESLERATEIAARIPGSRLAAVEVRPLMDEAGLEM